MSKLKEEAIRLLDGYAGTRCQIFADLGDSGASVTLHRAFDGNAAASASFLGVDESTVRKRFAMYGLPRNGNVLRTSSDARIPTHDFNGEAVGFTTDDWIGFLHKTTSVNERAVDLNWILPEGADYGRLHFVGDVHFGNRNQDFDKLCEFINWLKTQPDDRFIILGDLFEMRSKLSPGGLASIPQDIAYEIAVKVFRPVMSQCFVVHTGNHDQRVQIQTDMPFDPTKNFAAEFGVPWAGKDGFHRITLKSGKNVQRYTGYMHHGFGGAKTKGAKVNQLSATLRNTNADYLAMAHLHDRDSVTDTRFGPDEDGIIREYNYVAVRTGSFVKHGPGSYAREGGFPIGMKGAATIHLSTNKHDVHART